MSHIRTSSAVGGSAASGDSSSLTHVTVNAALENELREIMEKLKSAFTHLIAPQATIIGESYVDTSASDEGLDALESELIQVLEPERQAAAATGHVGGSSGAIASPASAAAASSTSSLSSLLGIGSDKLKYAPARRNVAIQKVSYSQGQMSQLKSDLSTEIHATSLLHHAQSLLGLIGRLKLSMLLAESAQDRARQDRIHADAMSLARDGATATTATIMDTSGSGRRATSVDAPPYSSSSSSIHPSLIPPHQMPLHLQRTQQLMQYSGLDLSAQMIELERQLQELNEEERRLKEQTQAQTQQQAQTSQSPNDQR